METFIINYDCLLFPDITSILLMHVYGTLHLICLLVDYLNLKIYLFIYLLIMEKHIYLIKTITTIFMVMLSDCMYYIRQIH